MHLPCRHRMNVIKLVLENDGLLERVWTADCTESGTPKDEGHINLYVACFVVHICGITGPFFTFHDYVTNTKSETYDNTNTSPTGSHMYNERYPRTSTANDYDDGY